MIIDKKIKTGSDFCGVGAFDQALKRLSIDQDKKFACDWDKYARQTYVLNYGEPNYFPNDVYDRKIPKESLDIYMTSPPCQSFSNAGKRGGEDDDRGVLFYNSHEFIEKNKPRFFIFENVKGLISSDKANPKDKMGRTFRRWLDFLGGKSVNGNPVIFPHENAVPYHIYYFVMNAKKYGIPQNRERIFIVGIRDDQDNYFNIPKPKNKLKVLRDVLEPEVPLKYLLSETMLKGFVDHGKRHNEKGNGFAFSPSFINKPAKSITTNAGSRNTENFIKIGYINQDTQASIVYDESGVSPCLSAGSHGYVNGYVVTKKDVFRRLTPRECFRCQDFPDNFKWNVSDTQAYKQAGNSIPVGLLVRIIENLKL